MTHEQIRWFGLVQVIGHLVLLTVGAISVWRIGGGGWLGAVGAAGFAVIYLAAWVIWLAPGSKKRLPYRGRMLVNCILGPVVIIVGGLAQLWLPALAMFCVVLLCDGLDEQRNHAASLSSDAPARIKEG